MMRIYIDGRLCDMAESAALPILFDAADLADVVSERSGNTVTLTLPATPANDAVFGLAADLYSAERFNASHHNATIECDSAILMEGTAYLVETSLLSPSERYYKVRITGGAAQWAKLAATTRLGDSEVSMLPITLVPTDMVNTWSGVARPVRFLPVCRKAGSIEVSSSSLLPIERVMLTDDYHPFISVRSIVRSMFAANGYELRSKFFESELAKSLYFSGQYADADTSRQYSCMDFLARRRESVTAEADDFGCVYASPAVLLHSISNIVDTVDSTAIDEKGNPMSDTFSKGDCFYIDDDGYACFSPSMSANIGFLLHLEYITEFRIATRHTLTAFDTIKVIDGSTVHFSITNAYTDYHNTPANGARYRVVVFDHTEGRTYILRRGTYTIGTFSERTTQLLVPASTASIGGGCSLYYYDSDPEQVLPYEEDWAMYAGYVKEVNTTKVRVDIRMPAKAMAAKSKQRIDNIVFSGAEEGMKITVCPETSLRPTFSLGVGYGSQVTFADVATHDVSQLEFYAAVSHIFNLATYTDVRNRIVYVEPLEEFYDADKEVDWTHKIDHSKAVSLVDLGLDAPQWREFGYAEGDAASAELNANLYSPLGVWRTENTLYGAKQTTKKMRNPLFTTTVNNKSVVGSAMSAYIMRVGDKVEDATRADTRFTPHIVRYMGMRALPSNQKWGYPHYENSYPLAAFHFAGDSYGGGCSLCFENRDGQSGVSRFYREQLCRERMRQRLTLSLRLTPKEVELLFTPDGVSPSLMSTFRFTINGESSRFRLCGMESYNPSEPSTQCSFERLMED